MKVMDHSSSPISHASAPKDEEERSLVDETSREETLLAGADAAASPTEPQDGAGDPGTKRQVGGAAAAGAIAGLVLGGPILACIAAGGAAAMATSRSKAGDVARQSGEAMANAGDRLRRFDNKHKVVQKTSRGLSKSANWVSKKVQPKGEHRTFLTA